MFARVHGLCLQRLLALLALGAAECLRERARERESMRGGAAGGKGVEAGGRGRGREGSVRGETSCGLVRAVSCVPSLVRAVWCVRSRACPAP